MVWSWHSFVSHFPCVFPQPCEFVADLAANFAADFTMMARNSRLRDARPRALPVICSGSVRAR
jgi:hypothetical protein